MHASLHAIAKSLTDAAQAMGLDVVSALAVKLAARTAPAEAAARAVHEAGLKLMAEQSRKG